MKKSASLCIRIQQDSARSLCFDPLAANLSMHHNRALVIALGAFLWAAPRLWSPFPPLSSRLFVLNDLVVYSPGFVAVSRYLNGIGLAIVIPAIQSLVADSTDDSNRGVAFGWLQLTSNIGSILEGLCSVLIASKTIMGIPGWRFAFHLVWIISVVVGILVHLFAKYPRCSDRDNVAKEHVGGHKNIPWSALSFIPMWLELIGFSHETTAFIMTLFVVLGSLGGLFGGKMGDILAKRLPNSGIIILSQISSGSAIPIAAVLLLALPDDPSTAYMHGLVFFIMGFCISWNGPATNNPIFAEIVPEKSRKSIYALDRSFETILASFAPPIVGILAQHVYGYKPIPKGSSDSIEIETDRKNNAPLAKALYTAIGIPFTICCTIYSFLYCIYTRDR
ncbi:cell wall integrity and stress response component 3-like [Hibiscus syriacus]|uniref:Cell wall integrity and stress response component 3-like n=1 Tax=Hibiscus syriacus TaxID=106335 RepID=A0A6A2WWS8_HIBSY|nr:cell wall integrity and stress response component 3-like [Hibiscus syriacus]